MHKLTDLRTLAVLAAWAISAPAWTHGQDFGTKKGPVARFEASGGDAMFVPRSLHLQGAFEAMWGDGTITVSAPRIVNDSPLYTTRPLRFEVWATTAPPLRGTSFKGYRVAVGPAYVPLAPRASYAGAAFTTRFAAPPSGAYWLVLSLAEYDPADCAGLDAWCTNADSRVRRPLARLWR